MQRTVTRDSSSTLVTKEGAGLGRRKGGKKKRHKGRKERGREKRGRKEGRREGNTCI